MAVQDALDYLQGEIKARIKGFDERRKSYRAKAEQLSIVNALLAAATTIFIGIGQSYDFKPLSIAALITSSSLGLISALDGLYTYKKRWVNSNDTVMQLYELRSQINYRSALQGNLSQEDIESFHQQYQKILNDANEGWKNDRKIIRDTN